MDESGHKYKLLETSAITPDILLHPEYPNSLPWTTVQKKIRVLLSLLSNKNFPLQKHYGKASWDICVYCPHICHTCMKVSLLSTWRPFNKTARTAKCGQNKESPLGTAWDLCLSQDQHSSSGKNPKRNSCLCEAVIKYSPLSNGKPKTKQQNFVSFQILFKYRNLWWQGRIPCEIFGNGTASSDVRCRKEEEL